MTQRAMADAFADLSQKNPELREEFAYNSETQKILHKNGETLLGMNIAKRMIIQPIFHSDF